MLSRRGRRPLLGGPALAALIVVAALAASGVAACGETSGIILGDVPPADDAATDACATCSTPVTLAGQTLTPQQGGTTGTAYTDLCPGDQAVIGYQGFLTPPSVGATLVGGLQALCGTIVVDGSSSATMAGASLPMRGASQDSPWTQRCPTGQVVVGFAGRSGADLDQVAFECAPWSASDAGLSMGAYVTLPAAGGDGGTAFQQTCPAGQLARGDALRAGDWIDAFGLVCGTPVLAPDAGP
jgi:hypothetical protein